MERRHELNAPRCTVELCLHLEGVGAIIAGWIFEPDPSVGLAVSALGVDLGDAMVRLRRPDVVDCFAGVEPAEVLEKNQSCGFVALAALGDAEPSEPPELHVSAPPGEPPTVFAAELRRFDGQLAPETRAFLLHCLHGLVEVLRSRDVLGAPSVQRLLDALGSEACELARASAPLARLGDAEAQVDVAIAVPGGALLVGWTSIDPEHLIHARVVSGGVESGDLLGSIQFLPRAATEASEPRRFVVPVPWRGGGPLGGRLRLVFAGGDMATAPFTSSEEEDAVPPFFALPPEAWLTAAEVAAAHAAGPRQRGPALQVLRRHAAQARDSVGVAVEAPGDGIAAAIDAAYFVPRHGIFVVGWLMDVEGRVRSLRAYHRGGASPDVLGGVIRTSRPDVAREYRAWSREWTDDRFGFAFFLELPGASFAELESTLYFSVTTASGTSRRIRAPQVRRPEANPLPAIREILGMAPAGDVHALFRHLGPAVEALWSHRALLREQPAPVDVGDQPERPAVTLVVPVYGRHDLVEYQLALFADDPDFAEAELVYVVDDPRIGAEVEQLCRDLYPLFRVSCRVVRCARNHGFAGATNIGAEIARGRLLVLLNSDVMPKRPGWLSEMRRAYDALPTPGALGPKLLFPDGSIQHAGMTFEQLTRYPGLWLNTHPGKGYPSTSERSAQARQVPAVTAACLMVERELYLRVGGLDEGYIIGDFEDSDLCLKLRALGHGSYYVPGVELYHLERQSQNLVGSTHWRASLTLYNAWRHTRRWGEDIQGLVASGTSWKNGTAS